MHGAKVAIRKFVGAELPVPTLYEGTSALRLAKLVITTNPQHIKRDKVETERLMEKLDELCAHDFSEGTWAEVFDGWFLLYKQHAQLKAEGGEEQGDVGAAVQ